MQLHFWQTQSLAKYCVKANCPNTHILKTVCSVLSNQLFLVFGSNLAFDPKNKNQMHFSGKGLRLYSLLAKLFGMDEDVVREKGVRE